jgi:hypothetical protein
MRMVEKRFAMGTVALLGLALLLPAGDVVAAKKGKFKARINGKSFKSNTAPSAVYEPTTHLLYVQGGFQKAKIGRVQVKTLSISCFVDIATLPATGNCVTSYSSTVASGVNTSQVGCAGEGVTVTVKSLKGTRLSGTFEGTVDTCTGDATSPGTVKSGKFSLDATGV